MKGLRKNWSSSHWILMDSNSEISKLTLGRDSVLAIQFQRPNRQRVHCPQFDVIQPNSKRVHSPEIAKYKEHRCSIHGESL